MGEGAAVLVLEERGRAHRRAARRSTPRSRATALTNDAHHMTAPRPDGSQAARAMRERAAEAHVAPHESATSTRTASRTPLNDPTETRAIKQVFGDTRTELPVSGTKGYYGHALGASGAIEAAICALALQRGWLPPTVNLETPDPACDLATSRATGRDLRRHPAQQLVRLRRHQRGAGVSAGGCLDSRRPFPDTSKRIADVFAASPLAR